MSMFRRAKAVIKTPTTSITQQGDVAVPVSATVTTTKTEAPIPPGSRIIIETPTQVDKSIPRPVLFTTTTTEQVIGPTSFTPPAPPKPVDVVDSQIKLWCWLGIIVGTATAIFGLVRLWNLVMWGGIAVAGASAVALFVQAYPWLLIIIGLGVGLKFAGPYIWHTQLKSTSATPPNNGV